MLDSPLSSIWQIYLFPAYGLLYIFTGLFAWARRPSNWMARRSSPAASPGSAPVYLWGQGEKGGPTTVLEIADNHTIAHVGKYVQAAVGAAVVSRARVIEATDAERRRNARTSTTGCRCGSSCRR